MCEFSSGPMIGKFPKGAVDEVFLQLLVVMEGVTQDGREHKQERKERKEAVVGDERRFGAGLVVAELLNNRKGEAENTVILLELSTRRMDDSILPGRPTPSSTLPLSRRSLR